MSENKRLVLWERGNTVDFSTGKPVGVLLDPDEIFEGVSTFEFNFVLFPGIPGNRVVELPESFPDEDGFDIPLERMFVDELIPYIEEILGVKAEYASDDFVRSEDVLGFDLDSKTFFNLKFCTTIPCHEYVYNSNLTTITFDDECETWYDLEVISSYDLDILDENSNRYYPRKSTGNHAMLEKVIIDDSRKGLLWHEWSQWQGEELDEGFLLTEEEALELLRYHPEIDEIQAWLQEEGEQA